MAVSITTSIAIFDADFKRLRNKRVDDNVRITLDTSERPYLATIWAPTIIEAIACMQNLYPAPPVGEK